MYTVVGKDGDICSVLDTEDGVVDTISVFDLIKLYDQGVFVDGFSFDYKSWAFHVDSDNSNYESVTMDRVEQHQITKSHPYYGMLDDFCLKAKNLYNHANYIHRQDYFAGKKYIDYKSLYKVLKADTVYPDYTSMPTHHTALQVLRRLDKNWKSYFSCIKDYKENPSKYRGKPKPPKYLDKGGRFVLEIPADDIHCSIKDWKISFNRNFNGLLVDTSCHMKEGYSGISLVRIVPHRNYMTIEVCYKVTRYVRKESKQPDRIVSIDLGVDNFAAITNNFGSKPVIVNGKGLKSINQYYNKRMSELSSMSKASMTRRIARLIRKRNNKVSDFMHKASRYIIDYCKKHGVDTIVVGYNKGWKQSVSLGKKVNQKFVSIPYYKFIQLLEYKAFNSGINFILTEESYTSGTSFLDNEKPVKEFYDKSRRIRRGLFKSNTGRLINADINASYQIMKKVFEDKLYSIEGLSVVPVRVNVAS